MSNVPQANETIDSTDNPAYALAWTLTHFEMKKVNENATPEAVREAFKSTQTERLQLAHKLIAAMERKGFRLLKV